MQLVHALCDASTLRRRQLLQRLLLLLGLLGLLLLLLGLLLWLRGLFHWLGLLGV